MKVSSSKCAVKDCAKGAVADAGFFASAEGMGMVFSLCRSHGLYYNALQQLVDGAISFAAFNGKWNIPIPPYSHYVEIAEKREQQQQQPPQQEGTFVDPQQEPQQQ